MAKRGPVAKESPQRRNDGAAKDVSGGANDAPELIGNYMPQTIEWYRTWAESEQASQFTGTDWQRLRMIAPLVDLYFTSPSKDLMAEIRQNESKLGATAEDRQRLRWKIQTPEKSDADDVPEKSKPRERKDPRVK